MIHSKDQIISEFLKKYPDCDFKRSVLMREIPQECRTATSCDFARNSCVLCTNFRSMMARLRQAGLLRDKLASTRAMASLRICRCDQAFDPLNVLSWREECCLGKCVECPGWEVEVLEGREEEVVTVSLWGDEMCPIKGKKVHGRWPKTMTLAQLITSFNKELKSLTLHLYTAYRQWNACKTLFSNLAPGEIGVIEDYQQNQ